MKLISTPETSREEILRTFKQIKSESFKYNEFSKILKKKNRYYDYDFYDLFLSAKRFSELKKGSEKNIKNRILSYRDEANYLDILIQLQTSLNIGNIGLGDRLLSKMIKRSPIYLAEEIDRKVPFEHRGKLATEILDLFSRVWDSPLDESLKKLFFENMKNLDDKRVSDIKGDIFSGIFFESIEFNLTDYKYSISFPSYWYFDLVDPDLKIKLLLRYFKSPALLGITLEEYSLLKFYLPASKEIRANFNEKLKTRYKDLKIYEIEAILLASENNVAKKLFSQVSKDFSRPLFSLKKRFYLREIDQNQCGVYCIFKLLDLGFEEDKMLWWLI